MLFSLIFFFSCFFQLNIFNLMDSNSDAENFFSDLSDSTEHSHTSTTTNMSSSTTKSKGRIHKSGYDQVLDIIHSISQTSEGANEEIKTKIKKDCNEMKKLLTVIREGVVEKTKHLQDEKTQIKHRDEQKLKKTKRKLKKKTSEMKDIVHLKEELFRENTRLRRKLKEFLTEEEVSEVAKNLQQFWINHINVGKIRQTLEEKKNLVRRESLHLQWFFNKRHQFETKLFHSKDSLTLKADTPKVIGGHGTAPTPIEMISFSIGSQFCQ
eukprot:Anaeramoba_flamelloidesa809515_61.p1 GENE.a809515_61~~a809515_61.p1  ORF type:complete len:267 (+),score=54.99 a809515_61:1002-1802(+)